MNNKNQASGGLGIGSILLIIFVVLKLTGLIHWSWLWVLSPLWISIILIAIIYIVATASVLISAVRAEEEKRRKYGDH